MAVILYGIVCYKKKCKVMMKIEGQRSRITPKQAVLPMLIQDYLDICDPVLTFDRFMGEIELEKYLKNIPQHYTGRFRYDPVSMLKTVLFGFMANGYISLRELEDQCKVNLRFMYLMDHQTFM